MDRNLNKISPVTDYDEILNMKYITSFKVDLILGILDINNSNKYLVVLTSSKIAAKLRGSYIYYIYSVRLVRITLYKETEEQQKCIKEIIGLFSTRNFYYSNDYDISLSLYMKEKKFKIIIINEFIIIKKIFNFNVPDIFYSFVIFGYVGCKIDVDLKDLQNRENKSLDIIIIERDYKKSLFEMMTFNNN